MAGNELSEREKQILQFCEQQTEKLKKVLAKTYQDGKSAEKVDESRTRLKKLMPAKVALSKLLRAIKKRNYMLLSSDALPEVELIKAVVPDFAQYAEDIRNYRAIQK